MIPVPRDSTDVNELCTAVCEVGAILLDGVLCGVSGLGESRRYPCHEQGVGWVWGESVSICYHRYCPVVLCTHTPTHPHTHMQPWV